MNVRFERIELSACVGIAGHVAKCQKIKTRKTAQAVKDAGIGTFSIIELVAHDGFVDDWASR
jgi:pantothenate kinase